MGPLFVISAGWSFVVASTTLWAMGRSLRFRSAGRSRSGGAHTSSAVMVRPCTGQDAHLSPALASTVLALRSFPMKVRVAIASTSDAAFAIAESAMLTLVSEGMDARVVVTAAQGPNRKADQIARVLANEDERSEIVIIADSDVDFTGFSLDEFLVPLADRHVAAIWSPPIEPNSSTIGDRASAAVLDSSLHSFALLAGLDARGLVGKLVAVRSDALEGIGGFASLVAHVGEDMELARRLHAAGYLTKMSPLVVTSIAEGRTWSAVVERYARWLAVIRAQRPILLPSYPLLFFATPLLILFSALATLLEGGDAWMAGAVAIMARLAIAVTARLRCGRPLRVLRLPVDIVLADLLLIFAFVRVVRSRTTTWRGVALHLDDGGTFSEELP